MKYLSPLLVILVSSAISKSTPRAAYLQRAESFSIVTNRYIIEADEDVEIPYKQSGESVSCCCQTG